MAVTSLLDINLKSLIEGIEKVCKISLPRRIIEAYLDPDAETLHVRFSEPKRVETGEPLPLKALVTLFRDEDTQEITAIEILRLKKLLKELSL